MSHADQITSSDFKMSSMGWFFNGCRYKLKYPSTNGKTCFLRIEPAPEAPEILWHNLNHPFKQQMKRKVIISLITLMILCVSFGIIFGLKYANYKVKKQFKGDIITETVNGVTIQRYNDLSDSQEVQLQSISILIYICSKLVNKIFDKVLGALTIFEKTYTTSEFYSSATKKTVIAQFINTSCLIVIVHYILKGSERYVIWGSGSLLVDIWYIVIFNSMVLPLLYVLNFGIIGGLFKRCRLRRDKNSKRYTQLQAHKIYEGVPMDPVRSYTDIYQIFLTSLFFMPAFPLTVAILFGSLVLVYWIQKYFLLRIYCKPPLLQAKICFDSLIFIKIGAFTLSLGQLSFNVIMSGIGNTNILAIIQTVVTGILIAVPIEEMFSEFYT